VRAALLTVALLGGVAWTLRAQTTPSPALLVLAKRDNSLAVLDPATLNVVSRLPAGADPHEVVASDDGKMAFISNYGFGAYNTISVIDLPAQKALPPWPCSTRALARTSNGSKLDGERQVS